MTDTPKPLRLADLDTATVGQLAVERILRRLERLAMPLQPGVMLRWDGGLHSDPAARPQRLPPTPAASGLAMTVGDLARYAQRGVAATDWPDASCASDALLSVGESLWSRPIDEDGTADVGGWSVDDLRAALRADDEPTDPVRLAVGCALARWLVDSGRPITTGELAALASVTSSYVRQLTSSGELAATVEVEGRARVAYVEASEARRWLAARGTPGWARDHVAERAHYTRELEAGRDPASRPKLSGE